jgi:hypothetical protein
MDERVEAFLADVLALEGEEANVIREGVHGTLADYKQLFWAHEVNKRMKEKAAHACHTLCRSRVVEEIRLRKGTPTAEHLKLVLSVIDGPRFPNESNSLELRIAFHNAVSRFQVRKVRDQSPEWQPTWLMRKDRERGKLSLVEGLSQLGRSEHV